jgi:hypothetical protein
MPSRRNLLVARATCGPGRRRRQEAIRLQVARILGHSTVCLGPARIMRILLTICSTLLLVLSLPAPECFGGALANSNWRVIWFPPSDTMCSWNWVDGDYSMEIRPVDYSQTFPDQIKKWELAVVSDTDPRKKVRIQLAPPDSGNALDFSSWRPGDFRSPGELRDSKIDQLKAMGEGSFSCGILGDGQRYSNVARVTINRSYTSNRQPMIRLTAIQPFGKDDPIKYLGAWFVGPTPFDANLTTTALNCPAWQVDGTWRIELGDENGFVGMVKSGAAYGRVYLVAATPARESSSLGMSLFRPPIVPFTEAKVRLRISDRYCDFDGIPLTGKQREYLAKYPNIDLSLKDSKTPNRYKTYISDVFDIRVDKDAMVRFDTAFAQ